MHSPRQQRYFHLLLNSYLRIQNKILPLPLQLQLHLQPASLARYLARMRVPEYCINNTVP